MASLLVRAVPGGPGWGRGRTRELGYSSRLHRERIERHNCCGCSLRCPLLAPPPTLSSAWYRGSRGQTRGGRACSVGCLGSNRMLQGARARPGRFSTGGREELSARRGKDQRCGKQPGTSGSLGANRAGAWAPPGRRTFPSPVIVRTLRVRSCRALSSPGGGKINCKGFASYGEIFPPPGKAELLTFFPSSRVRFIPSAVRTRVLFFSFSSNLFLPLFRTESLLQLSLALNCTGQPVFNI